MEGLLSFLSSFPTLLHSGVVFGTVIMFGALGEILTQKSGNLNLGVPGVMYLGGIAGLAASFLYENVFCPGHGIEPVAWISVALSLVSCFVAAALGSLLYSFLTITLRTNQNVTGLTLTIFGSGVANFFGGSLNKLAGGVGQVSVKVASEAYRAFSFDLVATVDSWTERIGFGLGTLIFSYGFLTYVVLVIAVGLWFFLSKTRYGLSLRAVGENTATADAVGINVTKYKYLATCIGGGISGFGGLYYVMNYIKGTWENSGTIEGLGWLAVALVIFATWKPLRTIWGSYLFGVLYWMFFYVAGLTRSSQEIFKMLPYVVTLFVLIMVSLRKRREDQPPASLGLPYFREDR
ncbi:MAG: ABC transporter permease [Clostridia bacterium]|nr:ABC transporter permease [Clostridia bacterium]